MHFFVYEWTTGGGMVDEPGSLPASLVREGTTMIEALATDLSRIEDCASHCLARAAGAAAGGSALRDHRRSKRNIAARGIRAAFRGGRCYDPHRAGIRRHPVQSSAAS